MRHAFEPAEDTCRNCGIEFCAECLVYAFGPKKPPLCVPCALAKSGVRSNAGYRPVRSKREIRRLEKERRKREAAKEREADGPVTIEVEAFGAWDRTVEAEPEIPPRIEPDAPELDEEVSPFAWADRADRAQRSGRLDAF